jgi:hypothetical protein
MNDIRRINLFGGPGCGKSITATNIRAQLGFMGYNIELVEEFIKDWTYIHRAPTGSDNFFIQASQIQKEDIRLRDGVNLIVSDAPIFLHYFYASYHKDPFALAMCSAAMEIETLYPSLNIFLIRDEQFYSQQGRYENLSQAKEIDSIVELMLQAAEIEYVQFSCLDQDAILEHIITRIKK